MSVMQGGREGKKVEKETIEEEGIGVQRKQGRRQGRKRKTNRRGDKRESNWLITPEDF